MSDLRAVARGEGLILRGRSRTHYAKRLAQLAAIAIEVAELQTLASEIRV